MDDQSVQVQFSDGWVCLTQEGTVGGKSIILLDPSQLGEIIEKLTKEKEKWEAKQQQKK